MNVVERTALWVTGICAGMGGGYLAFDVACLEPAIHAHQTWATATERILLAIGQYIPDLHRHLPEITAAFGTDGGLRYARVTAASCTIGALTLSIYFAVSLLGLGLKTDDLGWAGAKIVSHLERQRGLSAVVAVSSLSMLLIGLGMPATPAMRSLFSPSTDPARLLISPVGATAFAIGATTVFVELTRLIRRLKDNRADPNQIPKI